MGQSYDDNAIYIGWSNLFDYTNLETLQASKQLPVPKRLQIVQDESGINLDAEINQLLSLLDNTGKVIGDKVQALNLYTSIIRKAETNNGLINYTGTDNKFNTLLQILNNHEFYPIPPNIAEAAYKNVASSNIYQVSHDIRNRDQAYTAISLDIMQNAAENSPKGNQSAKLNMLNPLTKYIMQYQNLVGKNVISIAANGEKVWFNAFYYWTQILKSGDKEAIDRLKFSQQFDRIQGRAGYLKGADNLSSKIVTHLPDLNQRDQMIKAALLAEFGASKESLEYKYVDQLISQLLSAATDNAKELILAKINAGTNFARMYVYAMMVGFNIDDIVAFMTSPVSEFIDQIASPNIFQNENVNNNATMAINIANGIIGTSRFLHGKALVLQEDPETGETYYDNINKNTYVISALNKLDDELIAVMRGQAGLGEGQNFAGLGQMMQNLIMVAVNYPQYKNLDIRDLITSNDSEINSYVAYCQDVIAKLRRVRSRYNNSQDFLNDIKEFKKLYDLSTEISSIASAWLGLNQGLPTDELGILKRLISMSKIVSSREAALDIKVSDIYENEQNQPSQLEEDSSWEVISQNSRKTKNPEQLAINKQQLISRIQENNPTLQNIEERLDAAHDAGLINNFDIVEYLTNQEYRQKARDYYGLIMGTLNVFDMMEVIPHYKQIIECFKTLVVSNNTLASKSRLINQLLQATNSSNVTDQQLNGIIRYVDKLNAVQFTRQLPPIATKETVEGFNPYFQNIKTNKIELDTFEGLTTFKHWMEHEFLSWLRTQSKNPANTKLYNNSLVKHLVIVPDNDNRLLSTDIDLLNPNVTAVTRESYDEILRGIAELEKVDYDDDYTIADLLQLYNLVVNNNRYGGERLTTAFKVCTSPGNIENRYFDYIAKQDWNINEMQEYDYIDYLINSAPIISTYSERFHTEPFVKVNDPVRGYILKRLGNDNEYREYDVIPPIIGEETNEEKLRRLENFAVGSMEMPHMHNVNYLTKNIDFDGNYNSMSEEDQKTLFNSINNLLKQYSTSNRLLIFEDCD